MYVLYLTVDGRLSFGFDPLRSLTRNTATVTAELMLGVIRVKTRHTVLEEQFHHFHCNRKKNTYNVDAATSKTSACCVCGPYSCAYRVGPEHLLVGPMTHGNSDGDRGKTGLITNVIDVGARGGNTVQVPDFGRVRDAEVVI